MNLAMLKHPSTLLGILAAALTCGAAFGLPVTEAQTHSILVFGGALALILGANGAASQVTLAPQTLTGLVAAAIGVAIAFGLQLTAQQQGEILNLTGVLSGALLLHGAAHTVVKGLAVRRASVSIPAVQFGELKVAPVPPGGSIEVHTAAGEGLTPGPGGPVA